MNWKMKFVVINEMGYGWTGLWLESKMGYGWNQKWVTVEMGYGWNQNGLQLKWVMVEIRMGYNWNGLWLESEMSNDVWLFWVKKTS